MGREDGETARSVTLQGLEVMDYDESGTEKSKLYKNANVVYVKGSNEQWVEQLVQKLLTASEAAQLRTDRREKFLPHMSINNQQMTKQFDATKIMETLGQTDFGTHKFSQIYIVDRVSRDMFCF